MTARRPKLGSRRPRCRGIRWRRRRWNRASAPSRQTLVRRERTPAGPQAPAPAAARVRAPPSRLAVGRPRAPLPGSGAGATARSTRVARSGGLRRPSQTLMASGSMSAATSRRRSSSSTRLSPSGPVRRLIEDSRPVRRSRPVPLSQALVRPPRTHLAAALAGECRTLKR